MIELNLTAKPELKTIAIRIWKGCWANGYDNLPTPNQTGGYVATFHTGQSIDKAEWYETPEEVLKKYPKYEWGYKDDYDPEDVVDVGIDWDSLNSNDR